MEAFKVSIEDFQANFEKFLVAGNPVSITFRGSTIAHFIPTAAPDSALMTALIEPGGKRDRRRVPRTNSVNAIAAQFAAAQKRSK